MSQPTESASDPVLLSICIATYQRGAFIGQTIDSILEQMVSGVELLVVDGASPDDTAQVMHSLREKHPEIVYRREERNSGVDVDYDKAVGYARGRYCWLMSDDDVLLPNALHRLLTVLKEDPDLVVLNSEVRNKSLSALLHPRLLPVAADVSFEPKDNEPFFVLAANYLTFIGAVIIRRELWLSRAREPYYGSNFIHVGVIFQAPVPGTIRILADPLVSIRYGNALWSARSFDIWVNKWPDLIWSLSQFSEPSRRRVTRRSPALGLRRLLWFRAIGAMREAEYRRIVQDHAPIHTRILARLAMLLPSRMLNAALAVYCLFSIDAYARMKLFELARAAVGGATARRLASLRGVRDV